MGVELARIFVCVVLGIVIANIIDDYQMKKKAKQYLNERYPDMKVRSSIYCNMYNEAIQTRNKSRAKQALRNNCEMCPDRSENCMRTLFCPECPHACGWENIPMPRK